jgi:type IX secretion system PorP/SprF family membrane protein
MSTLKTSILIFFFALLNISGKEMFGQDIHFSQFNASPQNLNPSQTGLFSGDWRFVGNYRNQWSAIPVPYKTFSLATDTRIKTTLKSATPAAGILINNDVSGDSKFTTMQILLSIAYIKKLNKDSTHFISFGIQPGFSSKSINLAALSFDNQYNGDTYNPASSSGENFVTTHITYFDIGGGLSYLWKKSSRTLLSIGVSANHLNRPEQTFFNNPDVRLNIRTSINGIAEFPVSGQIDLVPTFMFQQQDKFHETVLGASGKFYLKPIDGMTTAVSFGGYYRLKDAAIFTANMEYKNFNVGLSYDFNTSPLHVANNYRGGVELSVIYILKKVVPFVAKKRICPIDM